MIFPLFWLDSYVFFVGPLDYILMGIMSLTWRSSREDPRCTSLHARGVSVPSLPFSFGSVVLILCSRVFYWALHCVMLCVLVYMARDLWLRCLLRRWLFKNDAREIPTE